MTATDAAIKHIPAAEYLATMALSNSGMKDLAVSPLRYWHLNINPNRSARDETPEQQFGTALHCLVLEGESAFASRYACAPEESDYPDCLVTMEDLRGWLKARNIAPKGTRKDQLIQQVKSVSPSVPIWDVIQDECDAANTGKRVGCKAEFDRLRGAADALLAEPKLREILRNGEPEVSLFGNDPTTGIPLKARLDWISDDYILDLKSFFQKRGKSIDQSVADAIYYEGYFRQAYFYATMHQQITGRSKPLPVVMAFVESEPPHEVRLRELRPFNHGVMNVYWQTAALDVRHYCSLWDKFMREFRDNPWRSTQQIDPLIDEEMRGLVFEIPTARLDYGSLTKK